MSNLNIKKIRYEWIDALRAMAIIFVIYGHCNPGINVFYVFTSPVKMPLFFILSGFLFNERNGEFKKYFNGTWIKLVLPWILLSLIALIPSLIGFALSHNFTGVLNDIKNILLGVDHWFMPCFIIGSILHFLIRKYVKSELIRCIISLVCFFAGIIFKEHDILNACMLNRALHVQLFFYLGYCIKKYLDYIKEHSNTILFIGLIFYLIGCVLTIILYPNQCLDVHKCFYYDLKICLPLIIVGNIALVTAASKCNHMPKWITFIGRNSLVIYMLQGYGFIVISSLIKILMIDVASMNQPLWAFGKMVIIVAVTSLLSFIINRFTPIVTGGRK